MRRLFASLVLVAAASWGCVSSEAEPVCPAGQTLVCRAVGDCRCGPPCALGARCPAGIAGAPQCLELADSPGMGVCVDVSWASGAPPGMIRCGAELCPATASCIDWGATAGVRCAAPCTENAACASRCCATVSERDSTRTFNVCAPGAGFRCVAGATTAVRCEPPCEGGAACVTAGSATRCAAPCATDADCAGGCCKDLMGGGRGCAPGADCAGPALTPACSSLDGCVTVTYAARGDHCGASPASVEVRVRNDCTRAADVMICYERRDRTCTCGMHRNVAPGAAATPPFWACDLTGNFRLSSRAAGDAEACHPGACN